MKRITQAVILAAGKGTRLAPLTDTLPKPLVEVAGLPLVRWALRQIRAAGITRAVLNLHHLGPQVEAALGAEAEGVALAYSREATLLGTGGGIRRAARLLGPGPFLVVNADALQDVDLPALMHAHLTARNLATLAVRSDPAVQRFGPVGVDATGRVRRLVDAFDDGGATALYMFTGVHCVDPRAVEHLSDTQPSCIIRNGYAAVLAQRGRVGSMLHQGAFHDVGTPARWAAAHHQVLRGVWAGLAARAGAVPGPPLQVISPRATIHAEAHVIAPAVVASNAVVGPGAIVGPYAAIGVGAHVGAGARVEHSAVLAGASVRPGVHLNLRAHGPQASLAWPPPNAPQA